MPLGMLESPRAINAIIREDAMLLSSVSVSFAMRSKVAYSMKFANMMFLAGYALSAAMAPHNKPAVNRSTTDPLKAMGAMIMP
jgi:hypothetical protein